MHVTNSLSFCLYEMSLFPQHHWRIFSLCMNFWFGGYFLSMSWSYPTIVFWLPLFLLRSQLLAFSVITAPLTAICLLFLWLLPPYPWWIFFFFFSSFLFTNFSVMILGVDFFWFFLFRVYRNSWTLNLIFHKFGDNSQLLSL